MTALFHQFDFSGIVCILPYEPPFDPTLTRTTRQPSLPRVTQIFPIDLDYEVPSVQFVWLDRRSWDLFSVIGRELYGEVDFRFRSIAKTMFTLYLMLTLDDWYFIPLAIEDNGKPFLAYLHDAFDLQQRRRMMHHRRKILGGRKTIQMKKNKSQGIINNKIGWHYYFIHEEDL